ncbi:MAG: Nif3-like dinuclear metal center hexameric protein [Chromatiaceae bacterium]|jgi:dinuclear metal center YbgI/SA1388 family protein|nr:Nif3-like dinuclear metal center hexameric protein [Chromatiaceae bacterium]
MAEVFELASYCDALLDAASFADYCPNGLQVEGERPVRRLITGVTASLAMIEAAADAGADALLVHHGWFWKGESSCLTGMKGRRVRALVRAGLSLLAYHLPLDAHPELGNNARLGRVLGLLDARPTPAGEGLVWQGRLPRPMPAAGCAELIALGIGRAPLHVSGRDRPLATLAWCTGAAQGFLTQAAALGVDAYLSGEISEQTTHEARELGVDYFAAGHHATERYGVMALGEHLAERFGLEHRFLDLANPA